MKVINEKSHVLGFGQAHGQMKILKDERGYTQPSVRTLLGGRVGRRRGKRGYVRDTFTVVKDIKATL